MTDMTRLRRRMKKFLAPGVKVLQTKLEAGEPLILRNKDGEEFCFDAIGDDHTYLSVGDNKGNLT
jgi:hypothetical protein